MVICVIGTLTLYMGFLMLLDSWFRRGRKTQSAGGGSRWNYQEQTNEVGRLSAQIFKAVVVKSQNLRRNLQLISNRNCCSHSCVRITFDFQNLELQIYDVQIAFRSHLISFQGPISAVEGDDSSSAPSPAGAEVVVGEVLFYLWQSRSGRLVRDYRVSHLFLNVFRGLYSPNGKC